MQYEVQQTYSFNPNRSVSLDDVAMDNALRAVVRNEMGISRLHEMQAQVMSYLTRASAFRTLGDVILCSPTGSGKTLAYALPIVQDIKKRKVNVLRAIVVVPTRDLALQVYSVFKVLADASDIHVSVISGAASIAEETDKVLNCNVLIATPGRLVDHVEHNAFDLQFVRYLVLDESDRLLEGPFQSWIDVVVPLLGKTKGSSLNNYYDQSTYTRSNYGLLAFAINADIVAQNSTSSKVSSEECVRKILVSATQTKNPTRVVKLGLRKTVFFSPSYQSNDSTDVAPKRYDYAIPTSLKEMGWVVQHIQDKPMALLKAIGWSKSNVSVEEGLQDFCPSFAGIKLVFTNSVESAHRLCRLLEVYSHLNEIQGDVLEMTGELSPERRERVLDAVRVDKGKLYEKNRSLIIVCSDVLARGMDMLNVGTVVLYDTPAHVSTYVHRVGRTARAGQSGIAITLLLPKQAAYCRRMMMQADRLNAKVRVQNVSLIGEESSAVFESLSGSLNLLKRIIRRENLGLIDKNETVPHHLLHELQAHMKENAESGVVNNSEGKEQDMAYSGNYRASHFETSKNLKNRGRAVPDEGWTESIADGTGHFEEEDYPSDIEGDGYQEDCLEDLLYAQIARNYL